MSLENVPKIPEQIRNMMQDGEIGNMRNLCGWAVGDVVKTNERGQVVSTYEDAWVELFNGKGKAGESAEQSAGSTAENQRFSEFDGVRVMSVDGGNFHEAYAHPTRKSLHGNEPGWYVQKFYQPTSPDYGQPYPNEPGVSR